MAQKKYTDGNGVSEIWLNIKNYVYSQLLGKADSTHTHTKSQITDFPTNYVTTDTTQTIGGQKTFSSSPRVTKTFPDIALNISDCDVTKTPTEAKYATLYFRDKNSKVLSYVVSQQRTDGTIRMCFRTNSINTYYSVNLDSNGDFYPEQNNAINLGNSTHMWNNAYIKSLTINGVAAGDILTHNASEFALVSDLSTVATSGSYNDLTDKPTIPSPYSPPTFTYDSSTETLTVSNTTATVFNYDSSTETLEVQING